MGIPVVVIRGILESGKTRFIVESLMNKDFGDLGKTLILAQECGEEEYDIEALKKHKIDVCIVENKEDWKPEVVDEAIRKHKPHVVFIEVNEMWDYESLPMPPYFDYQQFMTIIDGSTFNQYFNNMRQKFNDMIKGSEIVIINRCLPTPETSNMKRTVKMINNNCAVLALDYNGLELKLESDLPYSVKQEPIKVERGDFGIFYVDTFDSKSRYQNKIVEFDCMAVFDRKLPPKTFIAGRMAMTCCADDIQLIGHLCNYKGDLKLKNKSWIHLKATVRYMNFRGERKEQIIFEAIDITEIEAPDAEEALLELR